MKLIEDVFCHYWDVFVEEETKEIGGQLLITIYYENGEEDSNNFLTIYFEEGEETRREWGFSEEGNIREENIREIKELVLGQSNVKRGIQALKKLIPFVPLKETKHFLNEKVEIPRYNLEAKEYWFEIESLPGRFMLLYQNSGNVINFRFIFDEYPEEHFLLLDEEKMIENFKRHSVNRLNFLY